MNVYLADDIVLDDLSKATELICKLPPYCLTQLNVVKIQGERRIYQILVYCFDDEIFCSDYL